MQPVRTPLLNTVPIRDLRPTQMSVGMREVEAKRKRWSQMGGKKRDQACDEAFHRRQAPVGSTIMRPRISMCSAWQNHWQ